MKTWGLILLGVGGGELISLIFGPVSNPAFPIIAMVIGLTVAIYNWDR